MSDASASLSPTRAVLFVDDEIKVLQGLERMLRPLRHEWTMAFASSGAEALAILETSAFDVLVTDMRMPQMNGAELMEQVVRRHPGVIRIALSGHAEREVVIKAVHLAHQYLSKPCDGALIKSKLAQAMRLRQLMESPHLRKLLSAVTALRTMPAVYIELTAELQSANASVARVATIVARDPALTAKLLQLINSAYFGLQVYVSDPTRAVQLLGLETVRALALSTHVYSQFERPGGIDPTEVWQHGLRTARTAKAIAVALKLESREADEAFTAGLLHDVGRLVLADVWPGYDSVVGQAHAESRDLVDVEREICGTTHAEVAAYLFGLWGLPYGIVEAIAWHHRPGHIDHLERAPLTALHAADVIDRELNGHSAARSALDEPYLRALGLEQDYPDWLALISERSRPTAAEHDGASRQAQTEE